MESAAIAAGLNMKLVLVGEQKLNELLERPELEFVSQRLAVSCRLEPMEQSDTRLYLNHCVTAAGGDGSNAFSRKAAREIHVASRGVASAINALAAESQRRATASSASVVTHDHVRAVVAETRRYAPKPGAVRPANGSSPRPSTVSSGAPGAARPGAPAASPPPARSASPAAPAQPPVYPPGGPRQAYPVPPKVKRVPPPPPQATAPPDPTVDLDSSHPRVKEWVSRFTDGQPLRIGGASPLPITDPSEIPGFEEPPVAPPEQVFEAPAPPTAPAIAPVPSPAPVPKAPAASAGAPVPSRIEPNAIDLGSGRPLVTPEQLAPPPLVLNEKPAPAPAAPKSSSLPRSPAPPAPPARPAQHQARPSPSGAFQKPAAPRPMPSGQLQRPAPAQSAQAAPSSQLPRPVSPPAQAPARPAPPEPPVVLTSRHVKAHKPTKAERRQQEAERRRQEAERLQQESERRAHEKAAAPAAVAAARAPAPPQRLAPPRPRLEELDLASVELGRAPRDERTPRIYRFLAALIPIVLILGMAATAIVLSRRAAFDREPENADSELVTAPPPAPVAIPVAPPVTPPLVVTPDTEEIAPQAPTSEPHYCLSVGTYLFSDRAHARTLQLARRTHMTSWVVTTTSDGSYTYRVMLGGFATQAEAERVADKLLSHGVVDEALIEPMPQQR